MIRPPKEDEALYQIKRAIAQLEIVERAPLDVYKIRDVAQAVLVQLRAYLEEQE